MRERFLGVDIGGSDNTWLATIVCDGGKPWLEKPPERAKLSEIVRAAKMDGATVVAIDAPLSLSIRDSDEGKGMRASDGELRHLLGTHQNWVLSFHSLMAVPIRARLLADALAGTSLKVIETHPRACLLFALGKKLEAAVNGYKGPTKGKRGRRPRVEKLWTAWAAEFAIGGMAGLRKIDDGALDALVCATVAYLWSHGKERLMPLPDEAPRDLGQEPFFVVRPTSRA
jgi:predicted nuclease with RNAse H fold